MVTMSNTTPNWETVPLRPDCEASFMSHGNGYYTLSINGGGSGASVTVHLSDETIDEMVRLRREWKGDKVDPEFAGSYSLKDAEES
jgi:hypothetical protein